MAPFDTVESLYQSILGRPADAAALAGDAAYLDAGGTAAGLAEILASSPEAVADINRLYESILGRAPDAGGVSGAMLYLADGGSLSDLAQDLATSQEAAGDIAAIYHAVLGRAPDALGISEATSSLAHGGSLAGQYHALAYSGEAVHDLFSLFETVLDRTPDEAELNWGQALLASGESLARFHATIATGVEAQADIGDIYQSVLGRAPSAAETAAATSFVASGGAMGPLPIPAGTKAPYGAVFIDGSSASPGPVSTPTVMSQLATSQEVANDINAAYQAALGHAANAIEIAAGGSELQSGVPLTMLQAEIGELAGGAAPDPRFPVVPVTPVTLAGSPPEFVYSLLNDNALISPNGLVGDDLGYGGAGGQGTIFGFNPATDIIQVQASEVMTPSAFALAQGLFSNVDGLQVYNGGSFSAIQLTHGSIYVDVPATSLTAANFRIVS